MKIWHVMLLLAPLAFAGCKKNASIDSLSEPEDVEGPTMPAPGGDGGPEAPEPPGPNR